jgi:hypothetical protein
MENNMNPTQEIDLSFGSILSNAVSIGLKNLFPLIGVTILWVITIWIPYLNIGTTIAMCCIPLSLSKGEIISPTEIFNPKYRKYMGEFFILVGLMLICMHVGLLLFVIPGIVMSIAWGQAIYLLIDKEMTPMDALITSNRITYTHKWTIFLSTFLLYFGYFIGYVILALLFSFLKPEYGFNFFSFLYFLILLAYTIAFLPIMMGMSGYIYSQLVKKIS